MKRLLACVLLVMGSAALGGCNLYGGGSYYHDHYRGYAYHGASYYDNCPPGYFRYPALAGSGGYGRYASRGEHKSRPQVNRDTPPREDRQARNERHQRTDPNDPAEKNGRPDAHETHDFPHVHRKN